MKNILTTLSSVKSSYYFSSERQLMDNLQRYKVDLVIFPTNSLLDEELIHLIEVVRTQFNYRMPILISIHSIYGNETKQLLKFYIDYFVYFYVGDLIPAKIEAKIEEATILNVHPPAWIKETDAVAKLLQKKKYGEAIVRMESLLVKVENEEIKMGQKHKLTLKHYIARSWMMLGYYEHAIETIEYLLEHLPEDNILTQELLDNIYSEWHNALGVVENLDAMDSIPVFMDKLEARFQQGQLGHKVIETQIRLKQKDLMTDQRSFLRVCQMLRDSNNPKYINFGKTLIREYNKFQMQ